MAKGEPQSAGREVDIARNIRTIEWLKAELLTAVSSLFRGLIRPREEAILEGVADVIISAYLLGRRLGLSYTRIDRKVVAKLQANVAGEHELERWYGDLSLLVQHVNDRKIAERERL